MYSLEFRDQEDQDGRTKTAYCFADIIHFAVSLSISDES